jgi:hypothetical protein
MKILLIEDSRFQRIANGILDTPSNRAAAQNLRAARPNSNHLEEATTFKFEADSSPEDILINELETIDLHHGMYSAIPPTQ